MVKRKPPKKQPPAAPASKKKAVKDEESSGKCLGCSSRDAYVHLHVNSQAHVLFSEPASKPAVACVSCAFHASLVSQLRSALQDDLRRPLASCLVCRSSGRLLLIHQVEGASDALFHPSIESAHVTSQISPNRKLCTSCAYSLHWLFKQTLVNENKVVIKTEPIEPEEVAVRAGRIKVNKKIKTSTKAKEVKPPQISTLKRSRKPSAVVAQIQASSNTRSLRVRAAPIIELSDDEEEEEEEERVEPAPKRRKAEPVTAEKRVEQIKPAPSSRPTRTRAPPAKPEPVKEKKKIKAAKNTAKKSAKPYKPGPARFKRESTPELVPYVCQICSKTFESTVTGRLHELEHTGRKLDVKLSRCRTPPGSLSPVPGSLSSLSGDDEEKRRKPRKSLSPKKNAAKDRVHDADDKHQDFLFHAPAVLQFPKDVEKSSGESIPFSFDKPLEVKSNEGEVKNDFSDDEEEDRENVANCITSLETSEKANEDLPETEAISDKSPGKSDDKPKDQQNDSPITSPVENKQVNGTLESPDPQNAETPDGNDKTEERPAKQVASKTALSFDFFDEPAKKTTSPSKSLNSVSMDDLEEPYPDQTEKEKSPDKESETPPETPNTITIDTSNALRDDSTNPTLAQGEPESDGSFTLPSPPDSNTVPTTDLNQLEQLMAEVVGEN